MNNTVMSPEALYIQLRQLVSEMPDLLHGQITPEINAWLGRAIALVELDSKLVDIATIKVSAQSLPMLRDVNAQTISTIVLTALARAEQRAPAGLQGSFIPVASPYDALMAIGKVAALAKSDFVIVDAYADAKVVDDFAFSFVTPLRAHHNTI